jgi:Arc/MetJ-type ribon-helix-helix transcriptional regulator
MTDTTQITVRIPTEQLAWLDAEVARGRFPNRAAGIKNLMRKEQRHQRAVADDLKVRAMGPDPDEESRLEWMRTREYPAMDDYVPVTAAGAPPADWDQVQGEPAAATA